VQPGTEPRTPSQISWFVDVVAHELSTPLAVTRLAADMLASGPHDGADHARLVDTIARNTELAMSLLERFRTAQSLERDELHLRLRSLDLAALVAQSVDDLRSTVLSEHEVLVLVPDVPLDVRADGDAVREILSNLLVNAAKYSARGTTVSVRVDSSEHDSSVEVSDQGAGIRGADVDRIFDSYFQGEDTARGFGLGLYLARGLARAHGGDLTVRGSDGEGSTFTLELPTTPPLGDLGL
jgi:signal transduction histidine kinase